MLVSRFISAGPALSVLLLAAALAAPATAQQSEVRAVLFYSPTCPHCHIVMDEHLPPILARFGDQLQIITINAASPQGGPLYQDLVQTHRLPRERIGVPALVVGDRVLVGSIEIPQLLPDLVVAGLAAGGIDWPAIESMRALLERQGLLHPLPAATADPELAPPAGAAVVAPADGEAPPSSARDGVGATAVPAPAEAPSAAPPLAEPTPPPAPERASPGAAAGLIDLTGETAPTTARQRFQRDPVGNGLAVVVLIGLVAALFWSGVAVQRQGAGRRTAPDWVIPVLVLVGSFVAAYMSFVEVTGASAVCGPVGDCNTVQQSPYATLFGVLPVGVLGLLGYAAISGAWLLSRSGSAAFRAAAVRSLWAVAFIGTLFSVYLTFLEPFVIGATCAWCLASAVVMALILVAATRSVALQPAAA
jgi:uncharacterized membrane protein